MNAPVSARDPRHFSFVQTASRVDVFPSSCLRRRQIKNLFSGLDESLRAATDAMENTTTRPPAPFAIIRAGEVQGVPSEDDDGVTALSANSLSAFTTRLKLCGILIWF